MRTIKSITLLVLGVLLTAAAAQADDDYWYRGDRAPDIDLWTNKGNNSTYFYGEDVAVYFRTDQDCYVVVYDVDPSGEVTILYPSSMSGSSYAKADEVYRIPDYADDYRIEVSGNSGREHIFAVASFDYINPPDFMKYIGYDYGSDAYYNDDYFVIKVRGELSNFVANISARITNGSYNVAHTVFNVDTAYRHHEHYRYWDYDPYYVGSVWVGSDWPGCEVWIDGIFYGIAPVFVPRVIVGHHWVWVYYGGYPCYQRYFYVSADRRFHIDARPDNRYRDYKFRRHAFGGWVFEQKQYRNENGFRERARQDHDKNIRTRSLPPSVIRDYSDRGIIKKDAPIAKEVRGRTPERDRKPVTVTNPDRSRPAFGTDKPDRPGENKRDDNNGNRAIRESKPDNSGKSDRYKDDDAKVIIPEKPRTPDRVEPANPRQDSRQERKSEYNRDDSYKDDTPKVEKKRESSSDNSKQVKETKSERGRESGSRDNSSKTGTSSDKSDKKGKGR